MLENEKIERQLEKVSIDLESAVGHHYHEILAGSLLPVLSYI